MKQVVRKIFINDHIILAVIVLNAAIIFTQESGINNFTLSITNLICTIIFVIEMVVKHAEFGFRGYWRSGWNRLDGVLMENKQWKLAK